MAVRISTTDILEQIGEGGYGSVYLVQHPTWGEVVMKKLRDRNNIGANDLKMLRNEAEILKNLIHPNIVTLYEGQFDTEMCGLFIEHVKYGPVDSFLKKFSVSVEWRMQIIYDIASGMTYLHEKQPPIIHGDLKCQNVLIGNEFHAKICDFGLARIYTISNSTSADSVKGTLAFIAPEYHSNPRKIKTEKFDVYAYGILVWEIFSQKRAYHDFCHRMLIHVSVVNGKRPLLMDIVVKVSDTVKTMIQDCWHQNEEARPTFTRIKKSVNDENVRIQNKIKESKKSLEQQRNQHLETESQEQHPDSGVSTLSMSKLSMQSSIEQPSQNQGVQLIGMIAIEKELSDPQRLSEVAWLENKIYVVCSGSNIVHVFPDQEPFDELKDDKIEIKDMKEPIDMAASGVSRSIFIDDNQCIWRIQMPSKEISQWRIDGRPEGLSINSSDELIVVVLHDLRSHIYIYRCKDGERIKSIDVGGSNVPRIRVSLNAVQSSNGNFIIVQWSTDSSPVHLISEVSIDGTNIIRTFDPRSVESDDLKNWWPRHLSIDEDDNIFVADYKNDRVVLLNPRLDGHDIFLNRDQHPIYGPRRLCYVREKQMLIVGHGGLSPSVSLFSLSKRRP